MDEAIFIVGMVLAAMAVSLFLFFALRWLRKLHKRRRTRRMITDYDREDQWLVEIFNKHNTETFGYQGRGKDLIMSHVIKLIGRPHYANMTYDHNTTVFDLKDLDAGGNTYEDFINGTIRRFPLKFQQGRHKYISDCGIYLPSQYHKKLEEVIRVCRLNLP